MGLYCLPRSQNGTPGSKVLIIDPPHGKTNKVASAPSEDSDQPGHPPNLIRVFAVRLKKSLGP